MRDKVGQEKRRVMVTKIFIENLGFQGIDNDKWMAR